MTFCQTCDDTGNCPCGATDCGPKTCPDCYCDSCSEKGKKIVSRLGGKATCLRCYLDEENARDEDARDGERDEREPRAITQQDDPHDD